MITQYWLGVDIGGTFTDIVMFGDDGSVATRKVLSTPDDYSRGVVDGALGLVSDEGVDPAQIEGIVHASTVASNAVLEGKGSATALVTTEGFRDVLEMRRLRIPILYDLQYQKPAPLVPRRHRFEVPERMGHDGNIRTPLDEAAVRLVGDKIAAAKIRAVAISFLHSYANPVHEQRAAEIFCELLDDDVYITCSAQILPEIREYERTSTAVVNAYIGPVVKSYIESLIFRFAHAGFPRSLQIMQSAGGLMSASAAIKRPAHLVESGPAAGVVACAHLAKTISLPNMISLDMGGTTAKAALLEDGVPVRTSEYEVGAGINLSSKLTKGGGYAIRLPFIDLSEIGAGGGSIVRVDDFGTVKVGPDSAGADPGPVCYGRGGTDFTFTDALLVLGYLNADSLAGGVVEVDADAAHHECERIAAALSKSPEEAAYGVFLLAVSTMTRAVKAVSTWRGRDPRDFVLCGFGGNGPVTAVEIARLLQMERVVIPPSPGVFSATGLLLSTIEHEFVETLLAQAKEADLPKTLDQAYARLEADAHQALTTEGYSQGTITIARHADVRYKGQAYELTVPVGDARSEVDSIVADFNSEHLRTYGHASPTSPVDVVSVRVYARVEANGSERRNGRNGASLMPPNRPNVSPTRSAYFGPSHGYLDTPVVTRASLSGKGMEGPLLVDEYDATCLVPPGAHAALDRFGNIDIHIEPASRA